MNVSRRRYMGAKGGGILPAGYTQVEYIENTSTAYIDTGVQGNENTQISLDIHPSGGASTNNYYIGCSNVQSATTTPNIAAYVSGSWAYARLNITTSTRQSTSGLSGRKLIRKNGNVVEFVGTSKTLTFTFSEETYTTDGNILFLVTSHNKQVQSTYFTYAKIYGATIDNVRNFVPCISPDNVVGLYDTIGNQFYSSPNGVEFVAGNPV